MDTIFAVSSGAPPAAIAILRISGVAALDVVRKLAGVIPTPRRAVLRTLRDPRDRTLLDRALVLVFPGPATATGEDIAEFHLHGGRAVVRAVESVLMTLPGLRAAEPGEFTRRALANGIIDLTQAEGLGDLLAAETETQRVAALRTASGGLRQKIDSWSDRLLAIAARVEAQLDFSDEDDVPPEAIMAINSAIALLAGEIGAVLQAPPVERLRDGLRIVLAGPPNAGKSTLFNALAGRQAAIVSPIAGTTRDRIEAPVVRQGVAYLLIDTAGLTEETVDPVEQAGIDLSRAAMVEADLVLWLGDHAAPLGSIKVHAKADSIDRAEIPAACDVAVSAATGQGVARLWSLIEARGATMLPAQQDIAVNARQRACLSRCRQHLAEIAVQSDLLIVAEHLRLALRALDSVTGRADVEAVLDALFSSFCIGK